MQLKAAEEAKRLLEERKSYKIPPFSFHAKIFAESQKSLVSRDFILNILNHILNSRHDSIIQMYIELLNILNIKFNIFNILKSIQKSDAMQYFNMHVQY